MYEYIFFSFYKTNSIFKTKDTFAAKVILKDVVFVQKRDITKHLAYIFYKEYGHMIFFILLLSWILKSFSDAAANATNKIAIFKY